MTMVMVMMTTTEMKDTASTHNKINILIGFPSERISSLKEALVSRLLIQVRATGIGRAEDDCGDGDDDGKCGDGGGGDPHVGCLAGIVEVIDQCLPSVWESHAKGLFKSRAYS